VILEQSAIPARPEQQVTRVNLAKQEESASLVNPGLKEKLGREAQPV
jgi:hypothetical protein